MPQPRVRSPGGNDDIDTERALFERGLKELYRVEHELDGFQAKLAEEASDERLRDFFSSHHEDTTAQLERVEDVFDAIGVEPAQRESAPLEGLMNERDMLTDDVRGADLRDLIDSESGRAIERLEMTMLETLLALSDRLDLGPDVTEPLETTRREAEAAVRELREISIG